MYITVSINEVMSSNKSTLADNAGLFPDWLELYNYGGESVELAGYYLCSGGDRWEIPARTLQPGEYAVVFCGGENSGDENELRSSFSISKDGANISLESAHGTVIEQFNVPALKSDESAYHDDNGQIITSLYATPGYENSQAGYIQFISSRGSTGPLVINEAMVYNKWYLPYNGNYCDWVEVKNISDSPVELSDFYLSDSGSERALYQFPAYTLAPGETYVVQCDDEIYNDGSLAPFGLSAEDDQLFLSYNDGSLIDYAHLHDIPMGCSYGRMDGDNGFFLFTSPSPGGDNYGGARLMAEKPVALGGDGIFNNVDSVNVELSAGGTIYYTLDGSTPTTGSQVYGGPITLTSTTVIRAINVQDGYLNSDVLNLSYIINENHTLPVLSIVGDPGDFFGGGNGIYSNPTQDKEIPGAAMLYENGQGFNIDCGIKLHGATSRVAQPKKSFKLCFRSRYDGELNYDLFGNDVTKFSSVLVRAAQEDFYSTQMRDNIVHQMAIKAFPNLPAEDYKYTILYINGEYWGTYNFREAHSPAHYANHYGYDESTVSQWKEAWDPECSFAEVYRFAMNNSLADENNYNYVAEHLNIDSVIGWCIIQAWSGNFDANPPNMRFYYSTEDDMLTYALVDLDLGMFRYDMFDYPFHGVDGANYAYNKLANKLLQSPIFQKEIARQLGEALTGPMSNENVLAIIDSFEEQLSPEIARDRAKWGSTQERWESMVDDLREYVTRKGGRAKLIVNSLMSRINISAEEKEQFFGNVQ